MFWLLVLPLPVTGLIGTIGTVTSNILWSGGWYHGGIERVSTVEHCSSSFADWVPLNDRYFSENPCIGCYFFEGGEVEAHSARDCLNLHDLSLNDKVMPFCKFNLL